MLWSVPSKKDPFHGSKAMEAYRAANELVKTEQKKKRCDDLSEYMHIRMFVCMYVCVSGSIQSCE